MESDSPIVGWACQHVVASADPGSLAEFVAWCGCALEAVYQSF